jgi:lipopolysaccharide/colanic/teichoic acid biosynthesis glycosyltransferase
MTAQTIKSTASKTDGPASHSNLRAWFSRLGKRGFDVALSALGLLILSPVFLFIAIVIKRESPGPIFYGGRRAGRNRKPFLIWKFRTMCESPESHAGPRVTASDDSRITPLGHWLRDTKINELPQLWNVLVGDMSMVGPRPEDYDIAMKWPEDAKSEILSVRPGITSPASIIYRDEEKLLQGENFMDTYYHHILPDKMRLDRIYVRYHTLLGDIDIIFWTLAALLPRIASSRIAEGNLFGGPISRFVRFNISWFVMDFLVAFISVAIVGVIWRATGPINLGLPRALLFAIETALIFGVSNSLLGLNSVVWPRAVPEDIFGIILSSGIAIMIIGIFYYFIVPTPELPGPMLLFIGMGSIIGFILARYRWRLLADFSAFWTSRRNAFLIGERVLIVGVGQGNEFANWLLRRDIFRHAFSVIGIVDDDPSKQGMRYDGAWVIGTNADLPFLIEKHDVGLVMIAISSSKTEEYKRVMDICINLNVRLVLVSDMLRALQFWLTKSGRPNGQFEITAEQDDGSILEK